MLDTTRHPLSGTLIHQPGPCSKLDLRRKFLEHVLPTLPLSKPSPPLNFGAPETLTNTEIIKFIHRKSLAENGRILTENHIIQNSIPGTSITLPKK